MLTDTDYLSYRTKIK